ncbi:glycosyltransferase family 4 protein [Spirochaetota bacterium]
MNIWYISKYTAPSYAAKVSSRGFQILKELVKNSNNCILITSDSNNLICAPKIKGNRKYENVDGVDVVWLRTYKYKNPRSFARIISWVDFEWKIIRMPKKELAKPDVVIASSLSLLSIINGLWLKKKFNCKLIFEVRDIWPLVLTTTGGISNKNLLIMFLSWIEKKGYTKADKVVGTMPNLSEHIYNVTGQHIVASCIPQGIDLDVNNQPVPLTKEYIDLYIPKNKFIICYAGTIGADNALETLFACARELRTNRNVHFLIVGDGYLKEKYQKENKDLKNITFAPRVEKNQVHSVLQLADIVYFAVNKSPIWQYGQSLNKVIDYMMSEKPILASYSGYPSMINEANCGFYVQAEDVFALKKGIEKMMSMSVSERQEMGKRGREWVINNRQFKDLAKEYLSIIKSI